MNPREKNGSNRMENRVIGRVILLAKFLWTSLSRLLARLKDLKRFKR